MPEGAKPLDPMLAEVMADALAYPRSLYARTNAEDNWSRCAQKAWRSKN
jgi:hypothetical protein